MVYTEFSTENADYVLQLVNHFWENRDDFDNIDALVLETGFKPECNHLTLRKLELEPDCSLQLKYCMGEKLPVFFTDVPPTISGMIRGVFGEIPEYLLEKKLVRKMEEEKITPFFKKLFSNFNYLLQGPYGEGRNAINARKIEEFVVPRVKEISNKEKPTIGAIFGAAHMGLEYDLKSKLRRDITIWNWKNLNFKKYAGLETKDLNTICEAKFNGVKWEIIEHQTRLFD